jgi:DNA-binding XRE family transcriptional regulator
MGNPSEGPGRHSASALRDGERAPGGHRAGVRQVDPEDPAARDRTGIAASAGSGMRIDKLHREWMKDPEYRAAHAATEEEFALASALIGARAAAGLSQSELALRMGTSQAAIARLESGHYLPSTRTLQRLAKATGTRLRIFFVPEEASAQP